MTNASEPSRDELLFLQLVSMFQMAAMQQLGKIPDPLTNDVQRNLDQAKVTIDTLDVLKTRTEGRLSGVEADFLDKVLFELHMNYVDESKRPAEEPGDASPVEGEGEAASGSDGVDSGRE